MESAPLAVLTMSSTIWVVAPWIGPGKSPPNVTAKRRTTKEPKQQSNKVTKVNDSDPTSEI